MPTARHGLVVAAVNNRVYAIGGDSAVSKSSFALRTVEAYNPTTNSWTARAPMPQAREIPSGAAVINSKIYVTGGVDRLSNVTSTLYVYTPASNSWAKKTHIPVPTLGGAAGAINGQLYVYTPQYDANGGPYLHRYDPATDTWTERAKPPHNHFLPAGYGVINGKFYVAGGRGSGSWPSDTLDVYDPSTNSWQTKAPMLTARHGGAGGVINGKLFVAGGEDGTGAGLTAQLNSYTLEVYDPATNSWTPKANMPTPRTYLAGAVAGSLLWAVGGSAGLSVLTTTEGYLP
jgi:N-acetylneuraminic acid mutarotase